MRYLAFLLTFLFVSCAPSSVILSTPTVTHTKTATITPTHTIIPTSTIPTNPGYFEDVGEIVEIKKHEGKWYGIDNLGRAEIVLNSSGEWVRYDRLIKIAYDESRVIVPDGFRLELNQDEITRAYGGALGYFFSGIDYPSDDVLAKIHDDPLPWGIVAEYPYVDEDGGLFFLSCYTLGIVTKQNPTEKLYFLLFNVPLRYESQVISIRIPDQNTGFTNLWTFQEGNVQDLEQHGVEFPKLLSLLSSPDVIGKQMVIGIQINIRDPDNPLYVNMFHEHMTMIDNIKNGVGTKISDGNPILNSIIGPENIFFP